MAYENGKEIYKFNLKSSLLNVNVTVVTHNWKILHETNDRPTDRPMNGTTARQSKSVYREATANFSDFICAAQKPESIRLFVLLLCAIILKAVAVVAVVVIRIGIAH